MKFICTILLIVTPTIASRANERTKVIDFEDALVEGVNKQPLDSLNQLAKDAANPNRRHLYRKRSGFKYEIRRTLKSVRYAF